MADDQTIANVLASILHHAATAGDTTLPATAGFAGSTSGLGQNLGGTVSTTNQEGQTAIDAASQRASGASQASVATSASGDVAITPGSDAVGLDNPNVSQPFGGNHPGIDLSVPVGTPLLAAESGTITVAGNNDPGGYGNFVEITAADGTVMRYGHLSGISVAVGDTVKRGQLIGKSGGEAGAEGAGNSTGPHLHFEVRDSSGNTVDPVPYLAGNTGGIVKGSATSNPAAKAATPDVASVATTILDKAAGKPRSGGDPQVPAATQSGAPSTISANGNSSDTDRNAVDTFLVATRAHESGGGVMGQSDYTVYNQSGQSNASGAYQFLGSTWQSMGGSTASAAEASPAEQDAIAKKMALQLFDEFHSWRLVAIAWYGGPGVAQQVAAGQDPGSPSGQGGYLAYGDTIRSMMAGGR